MSVDSSEQRKRKPHKNDSDVAASRADCDDEYPHHSRCERLVFSSQAVLSLLPLSRTLSGLSGVGGVRVKHGAVLLLVYGVGIAPNGRGSVFWNRNRGGTTVL